MVVKTGGDASLRDPAAEREFSNEDAKVTCQGGTSDGETDFEVRSLFVGMVVVLSMLSLGKLRDSHSWVGKTQCPM